jgi:lysophospholipase L1-like esterase
MHVAPPAVLVAPVSPVEMERMVEESIANEIADKPSPETEGVDRPRAVGHPHHLRRLVRDELMAVNPAREVKGPKSDSTPKTPWIHDEADVDKLLNVPAETWTERRDRLIVRMLFGLGWRRAEVARAALEDIEGDTISATVKGGKRITVGLPDFLAEEIFEWRMFAGIQDGALFPRRERTGARSTAASSIASCARAARERASRSCRRMRFAGLVHHAQRHPQRLAEGAPARRRPFQLEHDRALRPCAQRGWHEGRQRVREPGARVSLWHDAETVDNLRITFVGTVASPGPSTADAIPFPLNSEGHSGAMVSDLMTTYSAVATATRLAPNIITLEVGTNDVTYDRYDTSPAQEDQLVGQLLAALPNSLVAVAAIPPGNRGSGTFNSYDLLTTRYNESLRQIMAARIAAGQHVAWVNQYDPMLAGAVQRTATAAAYAQPASGASVAATLLDTSWMISGSTVYVGGAGASGTAGGGYYTVVAVADATHVTLSSQGKQGFYAAGSTVPAGAYVSTGDPSWRTSRMSDAYHPNNAGYALMADVWHAALLPYLRPVSLTVDPPDMATADLAQPAPRDLAVVIAADLAAPRDMAQPRDLAAPLDLAQPTGNDTAYQALVRSRSPALWYECQDRPGSTTLVDSSGHGHQGTISGAVVLGANPLVKGDASSCDWNGVASASFSPLSFSGDWSIAMWVQLNFPKGPNVSIMGNGTNAAPTVYTTGDVYLYDGSQTSWITNWTQGTKYFLAATRSGGVVRTYLNGALVSSMSDGAVYTWSQLGVGYFAAPSKHRVAEFALFGLALSVADITALWNAGH